MLGSFTALDAAAATIPTPGSVLNSVRPETSVIPALQTETIELPQATEGQTLDPNGARVHIAAFRIVGNDEIDSATLHGLIDGQAGKPLNLYELNQVARLITDHYRSNGYPVARAVIPAQKVEFGNLTIEVIEGRIDRSTFTGNDRYSDAFCSAGPSRSRPYRPHRHPRRTRADAQRPARPVDPRRAHAGRRIRHHHHGIRDH